MRIFQCDKCGCVVPERKILDNIKHLKQEGFIDKETEEEAKREIKKSNPYISCHNPYCDGLLGEVERESIDTKIKDREDG